MSRNVTKKVVTLLMAVAMMIVFMPQGAAKVLGDEAKKAYEVLLEPTLVYEYVYGYAGDYIVVANSKTDDEGNKAAIWGMTDKVGNEIISCKYAKLCVLDNSHILVQDMDESWSMFDSKGSMIYTYGKYGYMYQSGTDRLYAEIDDDKCYGYRILNYAGEILEEDLHNKNEDGDQDNDDDQGNDETEIKYTGTTKYDEVTLLDDGKHFLAMNYIYEENNDNEDDDYGDEYYANGWLVKADGTVIVELGRIDTDYDDYYTVIRINAYNKEAGRWNEYYVNMEGKKEIVESGSIGGGGSYSSSGGYYGHEYYDKYVRYVFPSLKKAVINYSNVADDEDSDEPIVIDMADDNDNNEGNIYIKQADGKWYCYDNDGKFLYNINLPDDSRKIKELNDNRLWVYGKDDRKYFIYGETVKTYYYKQEGWEIDYEANVLKIITSWGDDIGDVIDLRTGDVIYQNINLNWDSFSIDVIGEKYLVKVNGIYTLVNKNWQTVKELGAYNEINDDEYENIIWLENRNEDYLLEKLAVYDYSGTLLAEGTDYTYILGNITIKDSNGYWNAYNDKWEKIREYGRYNQLETIVDDALIAGDDIQYDNVFGGIRCKNVLVMTLDGDTIINKGVIQGLGRYDWKSESVPVKINDKWGIYRFNAGGSDIPITTPDKEQQDDSNKGDNSNSGSSINKPSEDSTPTTPQKASVSAPAKAKIGKAKAGKKKVSLTINRVKNAKGYLIQYSTNKKFKGAKEKYTTKTKLTIKKLKSKKIYCFRVKAYKFNGRKKVLSKKWSSAKKVKVK